MNEKQMYEQYKKKRAESGNPIMDSKEFAEQFLKDAATRVNSDLKAPIREVIPKKTWNPTPEQEAKLLAYYKRVCEADKQAAIKTKYNFDTNLMPLKDAKMNIWQVMKQEANERGFILEFDSANKYALDQLTKYFIRDESFNGSLSKGVALVGDVGRGKTFIMECVQIFTVAYELPTAFSIVDMKAIARDAQKNGTTVIPSYTQLIKSYDDVGFEEKASHYGNKICVFTDLINIAYNKFCKTGKVCHMTSNLSLQDSNFDTFGDRYGSRVESRLREMFNFIYLGGQDKRK